MYILSIILILVIFFLITKNNVIENIINLGYDCITTERKEQSTDKPEEKIKKHKNNPNLRFERGGII
mgnify:CR=1 FL=1|tara:strand:+ start:93 stop:293 length:201 start_codon:yes stop_codon:yes gene_type:complete